MPPKKEKALPDQPPTVNEIVLKKFLQYYDAYCKELNCFTCPDIINSAKQCLADNKTLTKFILRPFDKDVKLEEKYNKALKKAEESNDLNAIAELKAMYSVSSVPPSILCEPMFRALNDVQYSACKDLYIDDLPLFYDDFVQITNFINIKSNLIQKIHIIDCIVNVDSVRRFASCFNNKPFLSLIDLDYNEFGDDGCKYLCQGLLGNQSIVSVSLNYCNLGPISGKYLGQILANTAVKELYIDGNELKCQGVYDLIKHIAEEAEKIAIGKEIEEKIKKEEEEAKRLYEAAHPPESKSSEEQKEGATKIEEPKVEEESGKKKKKKKKGKKKSEEPPVVGPFVSKLHIADNSMDFFENGADKMYSLNLIHQTISLITKLIQYSPELEELDLHNNTIGNMSAKMILNALEFRQKKELNPSAVRVSEKIERDMFDQIMKMGKKLKKKKGKKKKKKK